MDLGLGPQSGCVQTPAPHPAKVQNRTFGGSGGLLVGKALPQTPPPHPAKVRTDLRWIGFGAPIRFASQTPAPHPAKVRRRTFGWIRVWGPNQVCVQAPARRPARSAGEGRPSGVHRTCRVTAGDQGPHSYAAFLMVRGPALGDRQRRDQRWPDTRKRPCQRSSLWSHPPRPRRRERLRRGARGGGGKKTTSVSSELTGCKTGLFVVRSNAYLRSAPSERVGRSNALRGRVQVITMRPCATNGYSPRQGHPRRRRLRYFPNGVSGWIRGDNL